MMKTESFNWQRPAKICHGVKDLGLLREKLTNADETKNRNFSSIYISRAVFIVGVIAVITFIMCLVLADKYQKSVNSSHHYASFVFEKGRDEHEHKDVFENKNANTPTKEFNAPAFIKLENISNRLPIEEINFLLPVTTVLRSLNASRSGRLYNMPSLQYRPIDWSIRNSSRSMTASATATAATTAPTSTTVSAKKRNNIQSLADLLRRTELKAVVASSNGQNVKDNGVAAAAASTTKDGVDAYAGVTAATRQINRPTSTNANKTNQATNTNRTISDVEINVVGTATTGNSNQTSIRFAQLESYLRRMPSSSSNNNNNLQHLLKYINCESSVDCRFQRQQNEGTDTGTTSSYQSQTLFTAQPQLDHYSGHDVDDGDGDGDGNGNGNGNGNVNSAGGGDAGDDNNDKEYVEKQRKQIQNNVSPWSMDGNDANANADADADTIAYAKYENDHIGETDEDGDTMFTADTRASPLYYSPPPPPLPFLTIHRNRVHSDPFRNFRASSPVEINHLQPHDQTESASVSTSSDQQTLHHRFSNRMYHNRGGGDSPETYAFDLEPYLKPPTPPPPTLLSFTPSYSTTMFHPFNDPVMAAAAPISAQQENDLRSEATAVEPLLPHIKPISLMVEIFPANEYELPSSGGATSGASNDNRNVAAREQTFENSVGGTSNQANVASLMSWKLAPFSQNRMRLMVNLFPQHQHSPASG